MSNSRRKRETDPAVDKRDLEALNPARSSALDENVQAIKRWETAILLARSKAERVSDWIACTAGSGPVLVVHVHLVWCLGQSERRGDPGDSALRPLPVPVSHDDCLAGGHLPRAVRPRQPEPGLGGRRTSAVISIYRSISGRWEMTAVLQFLQDIARHLEVQTTGRLSNCGTS